MIDNSLKKDFICPICDKKFKKENNVKEDIIEHFNFFHNKNYPLHFELENILKSLKKISGI